MYDFATGHVKDSKQSQDDLEVEAAWEVLEHSHKDIDIRTALPELRLVRRVELAVVASTALIYYVVWELGY